MTSDGRWRPDDHTLFLQDAAHVPGGRAAGILFPRTAADVVDAVRTSATVLAIGAQSSLTGGATPMDETLVSLARMNGIERVGPHEIVVQPGVTVAAMQEALSPYGAWFPPAPTFTGATAGGIVATNAAGAATFKYGSTREWVRALEIVLADGTLLEIVRGRCHAVDHRFVVRADSGPCAVPVPTYRMPGVAKHSAGYYARPGMDLVDLFIGSEGTLGIIVEITFRAAAPAPSIAYALVPCSTEAAAIELAGALRAASLATRGSRDPQGIDVCAIESIDRRSLELLREDGDDLRYHVTVPAGTELVLVIQLELRPGTTEEDAWLAIERALEPDAVDSPLARFCRLLDRAGVLGDTEVALPGQQRRIMDLLGAREAVPAAVNRRVGLAQSGIDPRIEKTAADMIVPFDRLREMLDLYRRGFEARGLDYAIWGHISDGNVHPNVIPRSFEDVEKGREAILAFGRAVERLGGCPLAEHGVGRNPTKQRLLRQLYGEAGIAEMRAVKRALDPGWKLAPGVVFSRE